MPLTDRPEDHVIEDDHELDAWFKRWMREQARKLGRGGPGDEALDLLPTPKAERGEGVPWATP
jgi:hypothetical protein